MLRGNAQNRAAGTVWTDVDTSSLTHLLAPRLDDLIAFRRDVHMHPEVGRAEAGTTRRLVEILRAAGLQPQELPGTGLLCDVGDPEAPALALRADLDALPLAEETGLPWASANPGVSHACGHDVHTAVVLGAGLLLADLQRTGRLRGRVRLVFQPAEEATPGGALDVLAAGGMDGVHRIFAVHCDPSLDVGRVGLRVGPITSAADHVLVRLRGNGGHTSRPHLTGDLVFALAKVTTELPAVLSRRLDPRSGVSLVWGRISAGGTSNAIPRSGVLEGTLRCLRAEAWADAGALLPSIVKDLITPYGLTAEVVHTRGVPPVVNDAAAVSVLAKAIREELGTEALVPTEQSLGGEDFGWYLEEVPGALARLGTRTHGGPTYDLHRGDFLADERAVGVGARMLAAAALRGARAALEGSDELPDAVAGAVGGAVPVADR
jgi:amidohydrolase